MNFDEFYSNRTHRARGRVPGRNLFFLCLGITVILVLHHFGLGPLVVGIAAMIGGHSSR